MREFADADVLSKIPYSKMFDNQAYFHGIADGWNVVQNGIGHSYLGTETSRVVYDGYHVLQSDATTLNYVISLTNADAGHPTTITLYYAYGDAAQVTVATRSTTGTTSSTYDLSGIDPGFYRVYCVMSRDAGDTAYNADAICCAPWTSYTGARSFSATPAIADQLLSSAASHFNLWRGNQLYFYDQLGQHAPFNAVYRGYNASEASLIIWRGWIYHKFRRIRYRAWLRENDGGNRLRIYYDYGGGNQTEILSTTSETEQESYTDLPGATFTPGTLYQVVAMIDRSDTGVDTNARIRYIMESPVSATSGFTALGALTAEQYVFGDTGGEDTRADLLSDNQTNLNGRLTRRDYAVRKASYDDTADSTWMYWMQHRYPYLWYRGTNLILKWGTGADYQSLTDTDVSNPYRVFDLRQLDGLIRGVHYHIEGTPEYASELKIGSL